MVKYRVVRANRASKEIEVGQTIYSLKGWDYGCSSDDTRFTGIEHIACSCREDGDYPFFTIPLEDVIKIND